MRQVCSRSWMLIDGREVKYEVERDQDIQTDKFCIEQQQFIRLAAERLPECHFFTSTGQDDKSSFVYLSILCKPECQFSLFPLEFFGARYMRIWHRVMHSFKLICASFASEMEVEQSNSNSCNWHLSIDLIAWFKNSRVQVRVLPLPSILCQFHVNLPRFAFRYAYCHSHSLLHASFFLHTAGCLHV